MLTRSQIVQFYEEGYLILPRMLAGEACDGLRHQAMGLVEKFEWDEESKSIFSTISHRHDRDRYFLESGDKVRFFFEEEAFDEAGQLKVAKLQAINKIGHALHRLEPLFHEFSYQAPIWDIITALGYLRKPAIIQSMYLFKQAHIGGEVGCHQDSTFIHTKPDRLLGMWFALEDATQENGCLWGLPGRYVGHPKQLFVRSEDSTHFEVLDARPWDTSKLIPLEVEKGSAILFNGFFPHLSYANRSAKTRHAYSLHFIDEECQFLETNWIKGGVLAKTPPLEASLF